DCAGRPPAAGATRAAAGGGRRRRAVHRRGRGGLVRILAGAQGEWEWHRRASGPDALRLLRSVRAGGSPAFTPSRPGSQSPPPEGSLEA
ncbi:hypothetical protein THAOC_18136, partial [Thalassiosira oceanica]